MSSRRGFLLSGRDLANRAIRAQRDTIRNQENEIARLKYIVEAMDNDIDELYAELELAYECESSDGCESSDECESSDATVYTSEDYLWACPDYEEDPKAWQHWKDTHAWLEDLDEDERDWRCAEGTIKALNKKLTRAVSEVMDSKRSSAQEVFLRTEAERKMTIMEKRLERLRRRVEQQPEDEHGDGLIGLAVFESWWHPVISEAPVRESFFMILDSSEMR
ncbi:hypothetical protein V492_04235 [Pseudogymnoascus sp. VKM F-4246]|nr:hypothetical protein V492_04235 [Pseudogymnoascus sp. VKM F-4246]